MKTHKEDDHKDFEPSPEMLAAHPELKIKFRIPALDDKFHLLSQLQGAFNVVMAKRIPSTPGLFEQSGPNIFEVARQAIEAKARLLGSLPGAPTSDVQQVGSGFVRHYQGCDIFYNMQLHIIPPVHGPDVSGDIYIKMQKSCGQRIAKT